jgi:hypothetical protein
VATTPITKRIVISLALALLAVSVPPVRTAVLDWIGAANLFPEMNSADDSIGAVRHHS